MTFMLRRSLALTASPFATRSAASPTATVVRGGLGRPSRGRPARNRGGSGAGAGSAWRRRLRGRQQEEEEEVRKDKLQGRNYL